MELKAGSKVARSQKVAAHTYNIKSHREEERSWVEQAEGAYVRFVAGWNPRGSKRVRTDAANEVRRKGCSAGLPPLILLFATRSPMRNRRISQIRSKSSCRSHKWSMGD